MLMMRRVPVVFRQQVFPPVAMEVAPHAVDVVGTILCVVILDEKCASLNAIIMPFAFLEAAHPCEFDLIEARLFNLVESLDRLRPWLRAQIFLDQRHQHALLVFAEFAVSNAFVLLDRGLALDRKSTRL